MGKLNVKVTPLRQSGTHQWAHIEAEKAEDLGFFARLFHLEVQKDNRGVHLDVTPHQRKVAIAKGAEEGRVNPYTLNT